MMTPHMRFVEDVSHGGRKSAGPRGGTFPAPLPLDPLPHWSRAHLPKTLRTPTKVEALPVIRRPSGEEGASAFRLLTNE